jgi:hypothetical protein
MKQLFLILALAFSVNAYSQDDQTVTLIVSGQGKTQDEARQNALRSAIEQAYGAFISSKTEILNDSIVKDEVVSVSNGSVQRFQVLSQVMLPNGEFSVTLDVTVSVTKLTKYIQNIGGAVEFSGALFAANITLMELYTKNETIALENLVLTLEQLSKGAFDYKISAKDPVRMQETENWMVPLAIEVLANENLLNLIFTLEKTIQALSLSQAEIKNYSGLKMTLYPITLATSEGEDIYYLRNENSSQILLQFIYSLNSVISNFKIANGIEEFEIKKFNAFDEDCNCTRSEIKVHDDNFRILLGNQYPGGRPKPCATSLFNNYCGSQHDAILDPKELIQNNRGYEIELGPTHELDLVANDVIKNFFFLSKLLTKSKSLQTVRGNKNFSKIGLVFSFKNVKKGQVLLRFELNDVRKVEEIRRITKYEIIK